MVSDLHAGFIVNENNASFDEVYKLIKYVQEQVKQKFDVQLEMEIKVVGET